MPNSLLFALLVLIALGFVLFGLSKSAAVNIFLTTVIFSVTKIYAFFFYQGFLSRTLTTHRTAGERRGPFFIPLYHFHPLTNIQTFIYNFACEMTITYF